MTIRHNKLIEATQWDSPHCDHRPFDEISLIVVHGISLPPGEFGSDLVHALFLNTLDAKAAGLPDLVGVRVSSHLFIRRDGEIDQFVGFDKRAWHAGVSRWRGCEACNDYSIGIELEGTDTHPYTAEQYECLSRTCASLMNHYGILDVAGHCHISPGRKTDPGPAFDWGRLRRGLAAQL